MNFWIIGNPENRRISLFSEALISAGLDKPSVFSYQDLLHTTSFPDKISGKDVVLRIESPGENDEVRKELILAGNKIDVPGFSSISIHEFVKDFGRIGYSKEWYLGFSELLRNIKNHFGNSVQFMNSPSDISIMFNKKECHKLFQENNIPLPRLLNNVHTYGELKEKMIREGMRKVFVKPAHSSSASGVVAFRIGKDKYEAISTAEIAKFDKEYKIYNSLKVRRYTNEHDIALLVETILKDDAVIEEWIPKASFNDYLFDLRVLVIGGKARHIVPRLSNTPITNLHLGNKRGSLEEIEKIIGKEKLDQVRQIAENTSVCFPGSLYLGVDLLISSNLSTIKVLEVNAFGDLLPGLYHEGESTYTAEIKELLKQKTKV